MARGYPDFFGGGIFPGPGTGLLHVTDAIAVGAGLEATLFDVQAKGTVYGGYIRGNSVGEYNSQYLRLTVDGAAVAYHTIQEMVDDNITLPEGFVFYLTRFDTENNYWHIGIGESVSFGLRYTLDFVNLTVNAISIWYGLYYFNVA